MATSSGIQTLDSVAIYLLDTNPSLGIGFDAPVGSFASCQDGSGLFIKTNTGVTDWRAATNTQFVQTANQNFSNTTAETTLFGTGAGSRTLPANFLTQNRTVRLQMQGFHSKGAGNITVRAKLNTTNVCASISTNSAAAANSGWIVWILLTCRTTGVAGTVFAQGYFQNLNTGTIVEMTSLATVVIDTTIAQTFNITLQYATLNAGNTITSTNSILETLN